MRTAAHVLAALRPFVLCALLNPSMGRIRGPIITLLTARLGGALPSGMRRTSPWGVSSCVPPVAQLIVSDLRGCMCMGGAGGYSSSAVGGSIHQHTAGIGGGARPPLLAHPAIRRVNGPGGGYIER